MNTTIGSRIGAVLKADESTVTLLGYGIYVGNEIPPDGFLHDAGITNPKLKLDNGRVAWGHQCWWGDEQTVIEMIGGRSVEYVNYDEQDGGAE